MSLTRVCIEKISADLAEELCRKITLDLPEYFGLSEANDHYAIGARSRQNFAAKIDEEHGGLISLEFPYPHTCTIYWMAIFRRFHRQGIGRKLLRAAQDLARERGAQTIAVETLAPSESNENYLKTYHFYLAQGFTPLFNLKPQGYEWTMVYMAKRIEDPELIPDNLSINFLAESDIPLIVKAFAEAAWLKPISTFEMYAQEQKKGERVVWVTRINNQVAG